MTRRRCTVALLVLVAARVVAEDWDFTPGDYGTLTGGGGDLTFGADSDWVPQEIKDNLLKTLKKVLDPKLDPPSTTGASTTDFYHAHVVCPRPCADELMDAVRELDDANHEDEGTALGGAWFDPVTPENLDEFTRAKTRSDKRSGDFLETRFVAGCAVIYHTYEYSRPDGMKAGDARRNILTPHGGEPGGYTPPDEDRASSYLKNYCHLEQIAFLIDEKGVVHVTTGTVSDLSKVTGRPMK